MCWLVNILINLNVLLQLFPTNINLDLLSNKWVLIEIYLLNIEVVPCSKDFNYL